MFVRMRRPLTTWSRSRDNVMAFGEVFPLPRSPGDPLLPQWAVGVVMAAASVSVLWLVVLTVMVRRESSTHPSPFYLLCYSSLMRWSCSASRREDHDIFLSSVCARCLLVTSVPPLVRTHTHQLSPLDRNMRRRCIVLWMIHQPYPFPPPQPHCLMLRYV